MANLQPTSQMEDKRMFARSYLAVALTMIFVTVLVAPVGTSAVANQSIYTDIGPKKCRTIELNKQEGWSKQICPGVGGYKLRLDDDDARMSVTIITPDGKEHPLKYWEVITSGFSSLGDKAEWRVTKQNGKTVPHALIVRVNANENSEAPEKKTSYLAVAKITPQGICVTDKIAPSATANEAARRAADTSANKPCLESSGE